MVKLADPAGGYSTYTSNGDDGPLSFYASFSHDGPTEYIEMKPPQSDNFSAGVWHHVVGSASTNQDSPILVVYIDGVKVPFGDNVTGSNFTTLFNGLPLYVGSDSQTASVIGDMADVWIAPGVSLLDGSGDIPTSTLRKFISADGKPVYLGANGQLPTGSPPAVFLSGDSTSFATNQGTGGAFTLTGTLTDASTSPNN
jgi:hypothetical protein